MDRARPKHAGTGSPRLSRRKYARIGTDQVISFAQVEARDLLGVSRDVSVGGIRFEAIGCEINLGDVLRIHFNVGEQTVVVIGRVAWATEVDPLTMDVGVEFIEVDPNVLHLLEDASPSETAL